jgi:hypothetical protein
MSAGLQDPLHILNVGPIVAIPGYESPGQLTSGIKPTLPESYVMEAFPVIWNPSEAEASEFA